MGVISLTTFICSHLHSAVWKITLYCDHSVMGGQPWVQKKKYFLVKISESKGVPKNVDVPILQFPCLWFLKFLPLPTIGSYLSYLYGVMWKRHKEIINFIHSGSPNMGGRTSTPHQTFAPPSRKPPYQKFSCEFWVHFFTFSYNVSKITHI